MQRADAAGSSNQATEVGADHMLLYGHTKFCTNQQLLLVAIVRDCTSIGRFLPMLISWTRYIHLKFPMQVEAYAWIWPGFEGIALHGGHL